jgi:transposase
MLNERSAVQPKMEIVLIEDLVPQNHILRKIDKHIDFSFIRELTRELYCLDNGRPAIDPVVFFKMLFIGYLFGIRSERQLIRDIEVNIAYRWFLGYSLTEKVPSHSTISMNRITRFKGTDIYQKIFDEIVLQAISHKLVDGKILYSDSTHLKASANKRKLINEEVEVSVKDYTEALDKAIDEDRKLHGKKELKKTHFERN